MLTICFLVEKARRYNHERNGNNKLRHTRIRQWRVVSADSCQRGNSRGPAAEGERHTKGANEMNEKYEQEYLKMYVQAVRDIVTINMNHSIGVIKPELAMSKISEVLTNLYIEEEELLEQAEV